MQRPGNGHPDNTLANAQASIDNTKKIYESYDAFSDDGLMQDKEVQAQREDNRPVDFYCLVALPLPAGFPWVSVFAFISTGRAALTASLLAQGIRTELLQVLALTGVREIGTAQAARIIMANCHISIPSDIANHMEETDRGSLGFIQQWLTTRSVLALFD